MFLVNQSWKRNLPSHFPLKGIKYCNEQCANDRKTGKKDNSCPGQNRSRFPGMRTNSSLLRLGTSPFRIPSNDFPYFPRRHQTARTVSNFVLRFYRASKFFSRLIFDIVCYEEINNIGEGKIRGFSSSNVHRIH